MARYIELPDGSALELKKGQSPVEGMMAARQLFPELFKGEDKPKEDTKGFKAAAAAGFERLKGESALTAAKLGLMDVEDAEKFQKEKQAAAAARFTPTEESWSQAPFQKFKETLGGSVPYMAAPAAAGLAALAAPASVAAGVGLLGAGAVSAGQFTGSNLARQMDTGKSLEEASLGKAVAGAIPQALVDTAAMALLPGIGKLFGSVGSKLTAEQAKAIASQTLTRTIADYTAKTGMAMGREGLTEAAQQVIERVQAGLAIDDPEARKEYIDSFIGGAVLGGALAPAGRAIERSGAKSQAAEIEKGEQQQKRAARLQQEQTALAQQQADEEAAAQALEAERQTPEYAVKLGAEYETLLKEYQAKQKALKTPSKDASPEEKAVYKEAQDEVKALYAKLGELTPEYRRTKPIRAQEEEKARVADMSPYDYMLEQTGSVSTAPTPKDKPNLEGYYEQQIAEPVKPGQELVDYVARQVDLANTQSLANEKEPEEADKDYVKYLVSNPVLGKQALQNRTPIPGLTKKRQKSLYDALQLEINAIEAAEKVTGAAVTEKTRTERLKTVEDEEASALEDQRRMREEYEKEQEDSNAAIVAGIKPLPETVAQGELFGGEQQRVNMPVAGTRVDIDAQIAGLQKELDVARSYGAPTAIERRSNRERVSSLLEQIRDLKERKAQMEGGGATAFGTESQGVQSRLGSLPRQEREQRKAAAARDAAYSSFKNGEADAKQAVIDGLIKEISVVRGQLKPETITEIEKELGALLDSSARYGSDISDQLDAISTRWRAGVKVGTFGPAETIPTTTTKDMLVDQMDRAYAQRERYDPLTMAMLDRIADNLNAFAANEDRRNIAAEWLNRVTTTGRASPEATNDLRGVLRQLGAVRQANAPEQRELGAELMPEQVAPEAATRIVNGKVQYVAPEDLGPIQGSAAERYAPMQKGTIFESFDELNRYLASNYLKAAREDMGITRETVARLGQQVKEHETKIANIHKQTEALKARRTALEQAKIGEDRAAMNLVADAEVRLGAILKRLADELEPLRLAYENADALLNERVAQAEETSRLIADNIARFKEADDRVVAAAQETLKAREELSQATAEGNQSKVLIAQQKVIRALQRQRNPDLYDMEQRLAKLQGDLVKARTLQPRRAETIADQIEELRYQMDTQRVNPYVPSSAFITFLNNDLRLELDVQAESRKVVSAGNALARAADALQTATDNVNVDISKHPEILAIKKEISTAKQMGIDAVRGIENDLALIDSEIEKSENASYVESQLAKTVEQAIKETAESRGFGAQMADVPIVPLTSAERSAVEARNKAQLEAFQASTARLQALSGQRIDFSKRREMLELIKTSTTDFAELDARIKELDEGIFEMQVRVELVQIKLDEATEKAASYRGPRKYRKEAKALFAQIEDFKKQIAAGEKRIEALKAGIVRYEKSRGTKQKALAQAELATSGDAEVYGEVTKLINDRMAKLEKTISNKQATINKNDEAIAKLRKDIKAKKLEWSEGNASPETLKNMEDKLAKAVSSQKERVKRFSEFLKEREVLQARKSNRLGITRTDVQTGKNVAGERAKKATGALDEEITTEKERDKLYKSRTKRLAELEARMETLQIERRKAVAAAPAVAAEEDILATGAMPGEAGLLTGAAAPTTRSVAAIDDSIRDVQVLINEQIESVNEVRPRGKGKVSAAARVQSAAPSKFLTGTEESKATPGFTKQPIVEERTPEQITAEKAVADANAFAARLAAAKTKEQLDAEFKAKEFEQQNQILDALEDNRNRLIKFIVRSEDELSDIGGVPSGNPTLADRRDKLTADIASATEMLDGVNADIARLTEQQKNPYSAEDTQMLTQLIGTEMSGVTDEDIDTGYDDRYAFRTVTRGPTSLQTAQVERLAERITKGWVNAPEIVVVATEADLPVRIRGQIVKADRAEGTTPGLFDTKTKKVYLIASNLSNANDVILTIAHEAAGHYGLRELLGDKYTGTMNSLYRGNPEVRKQADAKLKADKSLSREIAVEEVLAEMAEDPNPTPAEKSALRQIYERLRAWLRSVIGLPNITDAEVQQLVANARRFVIEGGVAGEGQAPVGEATYRTKAAYGQDNALTDLSRQIIAQPKSFSDRLGRNLALETEMNLVDMRAGLREALKAGAKEMGDTKNFVQAMYSVTKSDQKMAVVSSTLMNGPMELYTDEKGFHGIKSSGQNSAKEVFDAIGRIPGGNARGRVDLATAYMIAQRAANKGLPKLDVGDLGVTEADLKAAMADVNANPELKQALEVVRSTYNAYNAGLIRFLASTGAIPKATATKLLKDGDYVPFYRVRENGMADLVFSDEVTINIGDVRYQPYLAELKGGETRILPLTESLPRNTLLITDKALTNLAARNVAYAFQDIGKGKGPVDKEGNLTNAMPIHKGHGKAGADIIRFNQEPDPKDPNDTGERWVRVKTDDTIMGGIPAELIVKSLEGAHLTLPAFLKIGGIAGDILRSGVTRMPIYILRQLVRDPMAASFTGGLNYGPLTAVAKAGREFVRMTRGSSTAGEELIKRGLVQSGIFTGDPDDIAKMALQLAGNQQGAVNQLFAGLDRAAMRADAATRALVYDNAIKNGLSEVEADMATMESMNFYKRGLSPTVQYASRLIPFFNAQIQGLNVLYKAATGQMPFEEQQKIKQKFFNNAMLLVGTGIVYAMAMEDDEYFKRAKPKDKYSNFFVPIPGIDEPFKLPIPYEAGWFFSLAVAAVDAMKAETDGVQQFQALRDMFLQSVPGYSSRGVPQIVKPAFEVFTNKNFFSGNSIESARMEGKTPQERFGAATTEAAKAMSKALPFLSPVQIEHLATGYFGQLPLIIMAAADGLFRKESKGEAPDKRITDLPFIGSSFQKKFGGADADSTYRMANEATQAKNSYDSMIKQGRVEEAKEFMAENRAEIVSARLANQYKTQMGRLRADEERITGMEKMTGAEKRARIDKIDEARQALSERFETAMRKIRDGGKT